MIIILTDHYVKSYASLKITLFQIKLIYIKNKYREGVLNNSNAMLFKSSHFVVSREFIIISRKVVIQKVFILIERHPF